MGGFIQGLISRHLEPAKNVAPRLPGRFETVSDDRLDNIQEYIERPVNQDPGDNKVFQIQRSGKSFKENKAESNPIPGKKEMADHLPKEKNPENRRVVIEKDDMPGNIQNVEKKSFRMPEIKQEESISTKENSSGENTASRVNPNDQMINPLPQEAHVFPETNKTKESPEGRTFLETRDFEKITARSSGNFREGPGQKGADPGRVLPPLMNTDQPIEQVIKVNIGQITIKAVNQPAQLSVQRPSTANKPVLTLEDYLKQRNKR